MTSTKRAALHLLTGMALVLPTGQASGETASGDTLVQYAAGKSFSITIDSRRAVVKIGQRRMSLLRKDRPPGQYYRSEDAALIIDGNFIAFVPKGDESWRDCRPSQGITAPK